MKWWDDRSRIFHHNWDRQPTSASRCCTRQQRRARDPFRRRLGRYFHPRQEMARASNAPVVRVFWSPEQTTSPM